METDQDRLAVRNASEYCGIQSEFWDIFGHHHVASPAACRAIVAALGLRPDHLDEDILAREHARWSRLVDHCVVTHDGKFAIHLPESAQDETLTIEATLEDGQSSINSVSLAALPVKATAVFQ